MKESNQQTLIAIAFFILAEISHPNGLALIWALCGVIASFHATVLAWRGK